MFEMSTFVESRIITCQVSTQKHNF